MIFPLLLAAAGPAATPPPPMEPLTAEIEAADADRFAALYERTGGKPTAEQLQRDYLDGGSYGVHVFLEGRIQNAAHLAETIAAKPELYARAIRTCLPTVKAMSGELRATYLALHGLLPERSLPHVYLVVGADNSGGTAGVGAQVLGLEALCGIADTPGKLREIVRAFFAHETVHTFQTDSAPDLDTVTDTLLGNVLVEGAADFIATLVTGRQIDPARAAWAEPREAMLWKQFTADLAATRRASGSERQRGTAGGNAFYRWVGNYGRAPEGWPGEAGYWMGQRIWERWYARQPDKSVAIRRMLTLDRLDEVLAAGELPAAQQLR